MKKLFPFFIAASVFLFTSCSEKFDVAAPYKDITVVYGFLDMADTAHYIRIQKAFLDQDKSAVNMATEVDSNFYSNINVRIERRRIDGVNAYVDSIHLNRVNLVTEGYTKQSGIFFNSPNYAYKFTQPLDAQYLYRLKITNLTTGVTDSADAPIINSNNPAFKVPIVDDIAINLDGMNFYSALPKRYFLIDGIYTPPTGYNVNGTSSPASIAQAIIRFNWLDSNLVSKTSVYRHYDFDAGYISFSGTTFQYKLENSDLYNALSVGMGKAPDNVIRLLDRCDISVYLSTPDYMNYRQALLVQGTGLTGSEIAPVYTNVKGENVLGLFTSRGKRAGKITITERTIDSLVASPILTHTNVKGTVY